MTKLTLFLACLLAMDAMAQFPSYVATGYGPNDTGYYFLNTHDFGSNNLQAQVAILDGAANVVYRRTGPNIADFTAWPDGRMSFTSAGRYFLMDGSFAEIDTVRCANGVPTDGHDLRVLPNGHFLLLGSETLTMDLSGYAIFPPGNAPGGSAAQVKCGIIQELDAQGNLVWDWHAADHFAFDEVDPTRLTGPNTVDWTHCNALEQDADGNILLSCRHFNEVVKIDRSTGDVIWHLGGASNDFTFVNDGGFLGQHDIRRWPDGSITLLDNGRAAVHPARGVAYMLDENAHTATALWSRPYNGSAFSQAMGSVQELSDGGALICWGALTPENSVFRRYAADGTVTHGFYFTDTLASYRVRYFEELPFTLHRPTITCAPQGDQFLLTAETGWASYAWSTGASGSSITAAADDTVWVEVPAGQGWLRSAPFTPAAACAVSGIAQREPEQPLLYPDPATAFVNIDLRASGTRHTVDLFDALGRVVWSARDAHDRIRVPLDGLSDGPCLVRIDGVAHRIMKVSRDPSY